MASRTGEQLKESILGDANELEDASNYTMDVVEIRFTVKYDYTISSPTPPDTGERQIGRVIQMTPAQLSSILSVEQRNTLLNYLATQS